MKPKTQEDSELMVYLERKGWVCTKKNPYWMWCWRQPKTHALFQFQDALDNQHALDREITIRRTRGKTDSSKSDEGQQPQASDAAGRVDEGQEDRSA